MLISKRMRTRAAIAGALLAPLLLAGCQKGLDGTWNGDDGKVFRVDGKNYFFDYGAIHSGGGLHEDSQLTPDSGFDKVIVTVGGYVPRGECHYKIDGDMLLIKGCWIGGNYQRSK